jgi:hypothetical protein
VWYTSKWIVDAHLKDPILSPVGMVNLRSIAGNVGFNGCSFIHDTPYTVYPMLQRGYGIYSDKSRFSLSGSSGTNGSYSGTGDLAHTSFYRWKNGVIAVNGGTTSFSCLSMHFQECNIGLSASAISGATIIQNYYTIPSNALIWNVKPRGVILTGCTGFTFRENDFVGTSSNLTTNTTAQNVGAMLVNCGGAYNLGYRNDFSQLWKGEEVQGSNRFDLEGLELKCNTYNNIRYDQYLASGSEWRHNQGDASAITRLANNKFSLNEPDCNSARYDMYVDPMHLATFEFDYIRPNNEWYDPNSSAPWDGADCNTPFMDDFCPSQWSDQTNPNYSSICPILPVPNDPGEGMVIHSDAVSDLNQAKAMYSLVVDNNQKTDIEAEINNAFPMESDLMRNYLLARSPLSDEIMKEAIDRYGLLDSWHLTQVLLANSPLTRDVLYHLESAGTLNSFFMSFLYDAQITGAANYRKLLEYEIAAREADRQNALNALLNYYNQHADQVDMAETLKPIMLADGGIHAKLWLLDYYISADASAEAVDLLAEIQTWKGMADYSTLKQMQLSLNNDWAQAHPGQITDLENWAANPQSSAYGQAISVLHALGLTEVLPEPEIPFEDRGSMSEPNRQRTVYVPELSAFPNPASDHTFLTYPFEADGIGTLNVFSEMGQLVASHTLNGKGILELNTQKYAAGIYLLSIVVEGKSIVDSKLVVTE